MIVKVNKDNDKKFMKDLKKQKTVIEGEEVVNESNEEETLELFEE